MIADELEAKNIVPVLEDLRFKIRQLALFSSNELLQDVNTTDLKFAVVDCLLGQQLQRLSNKGQDRINSLVQAQALYVQFLDRLMQWGFTRPEQKGDTRTRKIAQFKLKKEKQAKIQELQELISISQDEDLERELIIAQLSLLQEDAIEDLEMIPRELEMLEMYLQQETQKPVDTENRLEQRIPITRLQGPLLSNDGRPLRPFVITSKRQQFQEQVFRPGHSLPTMSIEEYLDREMERGNFLTQEPPKPEKQDTIEESDLQTMKDREFDEFKDANPRGWGNRMNRG
ncbi:TAP42-like protein [Gorgonomyces haynaldii]|nr:TAP42-like protein [Gorgonomyces haynaldii]